MTKAANSIDAHVGSRVRYRRTAINMSQEKLGELLGVTFQQVQKYEKGANRVGASRLFQIATLLGVSVQYFFEGIEQSEWNAGSLNEETVIFRPPGTENPDLSDEISQLCSAYIKIRSDGARQRILDLVETLSLEAESRDRG